MEQHNTWALCKTPEEIDPRDYNAEYVFWDITDDMLEDLPEKIDLIERMYETYNQGNVWSCTAYGITHTSLVQNIIEFNDNKIWLDADYQWVHNQWKLLTSDSWWDYLENAARTFKNNGISGKLSNWEDFTYKIDWYVVENKDEDFQRFLKVIAYRLKNNQPLYRCFLWNSQTWRECSQWEITTVYDMTSTSWHATMLWGIDFNRRKVRLANSWSANTDNTEGERKLSTFEIDFDVFEQLCDKHIFNFRYWLLFDKKDINMDNLFIDFAGVDENSEQYKAVKRAKDNGVIKWVPTPLGNRLEPDRPITRLETLLVLYRMNNNQ